MNLLTIALALAMLAPGKLKQGIIIAKLHDDGYWHSSPERFVHNRPVYPVVYYIKIKGTCHGKPLIEEIEISKRQYSQLTLGQVFSITVDYD